MARVGALEALMVESTADVPRCSPHKRRRVEAEDGEQAKQPHKRQHTLLKKDEHAAIYARPMKLAFLPSN